MKKMAAFLFTWLTIGFFIIGCGTSEEEKEPAEAETNVQAVEESEQQDEAMLIKLGVGVGKVRLGMTVEQMESVLGKPDFSPTSISSVYADLGIEVIARDGELISAITCVRRIQNAPTVKECKYKTAEGIGIGSTESEIISAYGEPSKRSKDKLRYKELGIMFELADGQVNLIWVARAVGVSE